MVYILNYYAYGEATLLTRTYDIEGYYWRDYTGIIPSDAVAGGANSHGVITYIGQTLNPSLDINHPADILPGMINGNMKKILYEYAGAERSATEDVKILCSQHPEQLQWVAAKNGDSLIILNTDKHLIVGGHDSGRLLVIGRQITESGNVLIGKVLITHNTFRKIYLTDGGKTLEEGFYDVLVYHPTASISTPNETVCNQNTIHINIFN